MVASQRGQSDMTEVAGGSSKPLRIATNLGVHFSDTLLPYELKMGIEKNPSMAFCVIAILRFLFNEMRAKLTTFRGEITKGSTF